MAASAYKTSGRFRKNSDAFFTSVNLSCFSCYSNPASSLLWSQLASYLLQACPDELEVIVMWLNVMSFFTRVL